MKKWWVEIRCFGHIASMHVQAETQEEAERNALLSVNFNIHSKETNRR